MKQVRSKIPLILGMLAVYSKACELIWKGECSMLFANVPYTYHLQRKHCSRFYRESLKHGRVTACSRCLRATPLDRPLE